MAKFKGIKVMGYYSETAKKKVSEFAYGEVEVKTFQDLVTHSRRGKVQGNNDRVVLLKR